MTPSRTLHILVLASAFLGVVIVLAFALLRNQTNFNGFTDSGAAVVIIGGVAVGIERIIETMWTFIGGFGGAFWPLSAIREQADGMVRGLDTAMKPFYDMAKQASEKVDSLQSTGQTVPELLRKASKEIEDIEAQINQLKKLSPGNQRMQLLAAAASRNVKYLSEKYNTVLPIATETILTANAAIDGLQEFLATFKDNPGRRLISLYLGVVLGVVVATFFSLDIFQPLFQDASQSAIGLSPDVRVILTGMIIGFGSNPTHEVIRAIQEYKESQKGANTAMPKLP